VLNEEVALPPSVATLHRYLSADLSGYDWRIVIADNGSTDATLSVARQLSHDYAQVGYVSLDERGRGRALRTAWLQSDADVLAYMDVDLSTELGALAELVRAIDRDGYDLAIGSRLKRGARVVGRPLQREVISRVYSLMVRSMFPRGVLLLDTRDFQCGFKAISRVAARELLPLVKDNGWFFDTELLLLASKNGYRVKEVPVNWTDDPDSRVKIVSTAYGDVKGLLRLRLGGLRSASRRLGRRGDKA
jgi:glycosyltransferase involved in cell wall biosynthesis